METENVMQWYDDLCAAFNDMPEAGRFKEAQIVNTCPWCRVGLAHTREEHYLVKVEE